MKTRKGLTRLAIFALAVAFVGCSHVQEAAKGGKREIASMNDMGIIGPDGSVLLYYRDGDFIIVKNCDTNTVLGKTPAEARANCNGKFNRVPVESFKVALRNLVSTDRLNSLKPVTPDEVKAYTKDGPSTAQTESMIIELDKINAFITNYGAENANLVRRDELISSLHSNEDRIKAIKKINAEIEKGVSFITDQTTLTLKKFNTDKDQFLYTVLKSFDPSQKFPCGLTGSIEDRIRDCSYQDSAVSGSFVLVTRTKEFKEVHKDTKSGIFWGDRLPSAMNHYDALKACKADLPEVAGISGLTWRLPSKEEYVEANTDGIRSALPNMNFWWWSSSVSSSSTYYDWLFYGSDGNVGGDFRSNYYSVRCVAR